MKITQELLDTIAEQLEQWLDPERGILYIEEKGKIQRNSRFTYNMLKNF